MKNKYFLFGKEPSLSPSQCMWYIMSPESNIYTQQEKHWLIILDETEIERTWDWHSLYCRNNAKWASAALKMTWKSMCRPISCHVVQYREINEVKPYIFSLLSFNVITICYKCRVFSLDWLLLLSDISFTPVSNLSLILVEDFLLLFFQMIEK